ncbi:hypothetical protein ACFE04_010736 [Oxalis oulophora]
MDFKTLLFVLATLLLVSSKVIASNEDEINIQAPYVKVPSPTTPIPKAPSTGAPPVTTPPTSPSVSPPVKAPTTPSISPPYKAPISPPVKAPSSPPYKAPTIPAPPAKAPSPPTTTPTPAPPSPPAPPTLPPVAFKDCAPLCGKRCSLHSRPNVCKRACITCCSRCKCVPPGTYGNRELCGKCYTDMTTKDKKLKCP